jgi:hypothetical protein
MPSLDGYWADGGPAGVCQRCGEIVGLVAAPRMLRNFPPLQFAGPVIGPHDRTISDPN